MIKTKRTCTLPGGEKLRLKILSVPELQILLKVPTTLEQAKQILRRNCLILERLRERSSDPVTIGCPHCSSNYPCGSCVWGKAFPRGVYPVWPCCAVPFGGQIHGPTDLLELSYYDAELNWESLDAYYSPRSVARKVRKCRIFVQGHVEWAEVLIKLGGNPEGELKVS